MAVSIFRAGGLASGLDTNSIVDSLVKIESVPLDLLRARQSGMQTQVSILGDLASRMSALHDAAAAMKKGGVLALQSASTASAFSITTTTGGTAGRYQIEVTSLASAAKARSAGFTDAFSAVTGGTLSLTVQGNPFSVAITDGMTLRDVAAAINQTGAPVSASLIKDGTATYLALTNRDTGFPIGGSAADGLSVSMATTGGAGQALTLAVTSSAVNARFKVDGLAITRASNTVTDAVPGATLTLNAQSLSGPEDVVLNYDTAATQKNLATFVNAYNSVLKAVQAQLNVQPGSDRSKTLAGDSVVRSLQENLQRVISTSVPGLGTVRTLADLGVKTNRDGSLSIDSDVLGKAIARDPSSVDALFSTASAGIADTVTTLSDGYTRSSNGLLTTRQAGLTKNITQLDDQLASMQLRIDQFQKNLIAQFASMETLISGLKSVGNFLTQQENAHAARG